jgi:hypothetical protein
MLKLKSVTPYQLIKYGSFETWVLAVVSVVKAAGAESALPNYVCLRGITNLNESCVLGNKSKEKGKAKLEESGSNESEHQTTLNIIILN